MMCMTLTHDYADTLPGFVAAARMDERFTPVWEYAAPQLPVSQEELVAALAGPHNHAMAYAGHQFGQFVPSLGDGRAMLLGEVPTDDGLLDVHVKGSGRTVFSRGGDGQCPAPAAWREVLFGEALHGLGAASSRAVAVFSTGRHVQRSMVEPGAMVVRTARSHVRVGTFQFAALRGVDHVAALADYSIARWYPGASYGEFFEQVLRSCLDTVMRWMDVGFIHGVMNTDNTIITGETLDFGPCAFTHRRLVTDVFSSIDTQGRYAFGNQLPILGWNLARLAECLLPLIGMATARTQLDLLTDHIRRFVPTPPEPGVYVPRNQHIERAITDPQFRERYLELLREPTGDASWLDDAGADEFDVTYRTVCGT